MKNNFQFKFFSYKNLIIPVLLVFMMSVGTIKTYANNVESIAKQVKDTRVTLNHKNASLKTMLLDIQKQSGVNFIYKDEVAKINKITVSVSDVTVEKALDAMLANTGYGYQVTNSGVVVSKLADMPQADKTTVTYIGKVVDEKGEPIVGATVIVVDTPIGAITDDKGNFIIRTTVGSKVQVSFVGMVQQEFVVDGKSTGTQTIKLVADDLQAEDVIVTGYGNVDRLSFTGSATTVTGEELLKVSPTNVLSALQVFDPSLYIVENNTMGSDPNTLPEMYVRGQTSTSSTSNISDLTGETSEYSLTTNANTPVFILDGYEVSMTVIYDMDPTRIKSMTILKDAASTAIYGSRASNGVIVVETVAPKAGKLNISYSLTGSVTMPDLTNYDVLNASDKLAVEVAAGLTEHYDNVDSSYYRTYTTRRASYERAYNAIAQGVDTYWLSYPLQVGINHKHSLTADGGSDALRFSLSFSYSDQDGVMKESLRDSYSTTFNVTYKVNDRLRISNQASFTRTKTSDSSYGSFDDYYTMQPYWAPYDIETGELTRTFTTLGVISTSNPLYVASLDNYSISDYFSITDNFSLDYYINDNFRFTSSFSASYTNSGSEVFYDPDDPMFDNSSTDEKGKLTLNNSISSSWNFNAVLQYNKSIDKHNVNARLGVNALENYSESSTSYYQGFINGSLVSASFASEIIDEPSISDNTSRLAGAFLSTNYTYDNTYLFDLSVRLDGSSEFGTNNKYAPFWSFGTGINIHNYDFIKNIEAINILRVTANYGQTGQVNFSPYMAQNTYEISTTGWAMTGIGATLIARGNDDLAWEITDSFNASIEATLLDSRLSLGFTYYNKITDDLVSDSTLPLSTGFTTYKDNVGKTQNEGIELKASYAVIKKKDMGLTVGVNGARNRNILLELSDSQKAYNDAIDEYYEGTYVMQTNNPVVLRYVEGGSLTSIYAVQSLGISPTTGEELFLTQSGEVTTDWASEDQVIVGNTAPDLSGSISLSFYYKKFSVFTTFLYSYGGDAYNSTLANLVEGIKIFSTNVDSRVLTDRWQEVGDLAQYSALTLDSYYVQPTSRYVQKNNYLKFNSVSCSYSLGGDWMDKVGISMCRLSLSMNDIFTLSTVKQEKGTSYPFSRTVNFTANISF